MSSGAYAGTVTLNFNSLPSAQGLTYNTDGYLTEAQVFSVSGGVLQQNSIGGGYHAYRYFDPGVVADSPFELDWTAELIAEEFSQANNKFGFAVWVGAPTDYFVLGLGVGGIDVRNGFNEDIISASDLSAAGVNLFAYNNYKLLGDRGAGTWSLFINGTFWASGTPTFLSEENGIYIGDITDGPNAQGDTSAFSFTQTSSPEPATFWLLGVTVPMLMWRSYRLSAPGKALGGSRSGGLLHSSGGHPFDQLPDGAGPLSRFNAADCSAV